MNTIISKLAAKRKRKKKLNGSKGNGEGKIYRKAARNKKGHPQKSTEQGSEKSLNIYE